MSRLRIVRQGLNFRSKVGSGLIVFERKDSANERFGVVGCVQGYKLGLKHSCEKVCTRSMSSVGTGDVVRLWVREALTDSKIFHFSKQPEIAFFSKRCG